MLTAERRRDQNGRFLPESSMTTIQIERRIGAPEVREKTMRDTYLNAIRILEEHGWCQGDYHNAKGQYCLAGALQAAGDKFDAWRGYGYAEANLDWYIDSNTEFDNTEEWNDQPRRTQAEAIALLRSVASFLDE